MIKLYLKDRYQLLNNKSLYEPNAEQKYKTDVYYQASKNPTEYERILKEIFSIAKPAHMKFFNSIKPFILNYTSLVLYPYDSPRYKYSKNKIIIVLPQNKLEQISVILGSAFFYVSASMKQQVRQVYIPVSSLIQAYLLTKLTPRPLDFNDISSKLVQYLIAWNLKNYNLLNASNLSKMATKAGKGFLTANELQDVLNTIRDIKDIDKFFDLFSNELGIESLKKLFVTRFGIDITLSFEDIVHLLYNVTSAYYLLYPPILNQSISGNVSTKKLALKIVNSIASRLTGLPM